MQSLLGNVPLVELHRHLDVSIRTSTLFELAQAQGLISREMSYSVFADSAYLKEPLKDLEAVLSQFTLFQKVFQTPEILSRVAFEVVEDCYREGIRKVELRFSPGFVSQYSRLSWETILKNFKGGIRKALTRYPDIKVGLICIVTRDYGANEAGKVIEFLLENRGDFVGLDLAGNESQFPCKLFKEAFAPAIKAKVPITIHAGESEGPENVWEAIEILHASRIGHGVRSLEDKKLISFLKKKKICLEVCPTSNWITRACDSIETHPLPALLKEGVLATINTDDPGIFGITLPSEIRIAHEKLGLSLEQIKVCLATADRYSFVT